MKERYRLAQLRPYNLGQANIFKDESRYSAVHDVFAKPAVYWKNEEPLKKQGKEDEFDKNYSPSK